MGYPVIRYAGSGQGRERSAALWQNSLDGYAAGDPGFGRFDFNDCTAEFANPGDAAATAIDDPYFVQDMAAGGTVESLIKLETTGAAGDYAAKYGVWRLSATTGTDHFGIEMHHGLTATTGAEAYVVAGKRIVFETLIDIDNADTFFVGLTEPIVAFLDATSDLPTDSDFIGFYKAESNGILTFEITNDNAAGTRESVSADIILNADIPDNDWIKLGFAINADSTVTISVNGVLYTPTFTAATAGDNVAGSLPIELLTRKYCVGRGSVGEDATVDMDIDWTSLFSQGEGDVF